MLKGSKVHWWNGSLHVLKMKCSLGRYTVLCEVVVEGATEKSAIDEEVERDGLVGGENFVNET